MGSELPKGRSGGPRVLIATNPEDSDSFLVEEALRRKGAEVELAHLADFPSRSTASLRLDPRDDQADRWRLIGQPDRTDQRLPGTVWWRRPGRPVIPEDVDPDDVEFIYQEATKFIVGIWQHLPEGTVYINSPSHALIADRKPYQLRIAREVGLKIPPTLFSNDPADIRSALRCWGGKGIYKPFGSMNNFWLDSDQRTILALFTTVLDESSLPPDDILSLTPGIYQPVLPKLFELRLTVFGSTVFGAKIYSQEQERSQVDWRNGQRLLRYEAIEVQPHLKELCVAMLRRLGLLMGCFDFVVTPQQDIVFLEVNEGGQFLWLESVSGVPLLDAFSDFLLTPDEAFDWKRPRTPLRIRQVQAAAAEKMARDGENHVAPDWMRQKPGKSKKISPSSEKPGA